LLRRSNYIGTRVKSIASPQKITETIHRALDAAGLRRNAGGHNRIRLAIDNALQAAGLASSSQPDVVEDIAPSEVADAGQFVTRSYSCVHGARTYKLFVPLSCEGDAGASTPLVVMLHGCKQNPDDFAAGTRMNQLAEQHGFLVAYPAQTARANGSNCWNWFERAHQHRGGAEPSLLAGIVADVARTQAVDEQRVFVAGLSAGAAMAVILGREYPELFAAVAVHSGLPAGAAHDMPSAFAAMQGRGARDAQTPSPPRAVPTIVFHGDADATVTAANGAAVAGQAVSAFEQQRAPLRRVTEIAASAGGKRCTVTRFVDADGDSAVEEWVVHGGAHAWFGGSAAGSYTDPAGPDASAEIVRFFLER
jgi:poly(hydroxyalkanoate) depolymerase family esterase